MPATLATVSAITKEIYGPKLQKQLYDEVVALKRIQRDSSNIITETGGKYVTFPVHTRRNTGIGARNENEALPTPGQQGYAAARVGLKYLYGAMELTGQTIELVNTNVQAFTSALDSEAERLRVDLAIDLNRQVYGTATGIITATAVNASGTTLNVTSTANLQLGELIDVVVAATGVPVAGGAGHTILTIPSPTQITISAPAVATAATDGITRGGNYGREWTGFTSIISDTGVLHNLDPVNEPVWAATVQGNSGTLRAVSEGLFNVMSDTIKTKGGKTTAIFTTYGIRRAYANLLQQQRQFVNTQGKFDGGYTALAYNTMDGEIPMVVDAMAPANKAWFVNEDVIKLYREFDWKFMQHGGGDVWRLKTAGGNDFDAYTARLVQYSDLGTDRRNTHGVITDLSEN